mgnify:CR=1 FL=1
MDEIKAVLGPYLESEHIRQTGDIREGRFGLNLVSGMRNLTAEETAILERQGNRAQDWRLVQVSHDFIPHNIHGSSFFGQCFLGRFAALFTCTEGSAPMPCGISHSIISCSYICPDSAVYRCAMVSNCIVSEGAVLYNNGTISGAGPAAFANGNMVSAGPETGERAIAIFAELNMSTAEMLVSRKANNEAYREFVEKYTALCRLESGFIGRGCRIINTASITDSFIGTGARIEGALKVEGSTILSSQEEPSLIGHGVIIEGSIVQHGCHVDSGASLHSSLMMEYSEAEKKCIINSSIIGPNSSIGEGEVTSTLAGPFTVAHHQSLLIAAIWPGGRGNMGYGANVGSNHTSRLPDQEILPGEGMFFGLGCSVKFPADYRRSPYSLISTGTVTLPQRMEFPFSLISQPSGTYASLSPMYNELRPGWMLSDNLYTLERNENKYRKRNRARRDSFEFTILRPGLVDLMTAARDRLRSAGEKDFYTEKDVAGAGKNYITHEGLKAGIEAYTFFIRYYGLLMYARRAGRLLAEEKEPGRESILENDPGLKWWHHAKGILESEDLAAAGAVENMNSFIEMTRKIYAKTLASRRRDFDRGCSVIDDYSMYHDIPENDSVVREMRERTDIEIKRAEQIISMLSNRK